jgi:hypothetical protein
VLRPLSGGNAGLKGVLESPLGPLDHAVALRVVRRGGVVVRANDVRGAGPRRGGELGPLVRCEEGRNAKAGHPLTNEVVPAGLCLNVGERHCLQHPAGTVDDGEEVPEPLLGDRQRAHYVHVDVGELLLWHLDRLHSGGWLAGHFGPGTGLAVLHPVRQVLAHAGPNHSLVHEPPRDLRPWVCHAVEDVEHLAAVAQWNHRPRVAALCVAQHPDGAEGDELEGEAGVSGRLDVSAVALCLSDGGVVQRLGGGCHGGDGRRCLRRAGQGVYHHVVLSGNMPDVTCKFGQVADVAALVRRPWLRRLGEGEGERLVVRVQGEQPPLRHEAEVVDPLYTGQQIPVVGGVADLGGMDPASWRRTLAAPRAPPGPLPRSLWTRLRSGPAEPGESQAGGGLQGVLGRLERGPHLLGPL